jgi:hypothetical protein
MIADWRQRDNVGRDIIGITGREEDIYDGGVSSDDTLSNFERNKTRPLLLCGPRSVI